MKYLKLYEDIKYDFSVGEIIVCTKHEKRCLYDMVHYCHCPDFGKKYLVLRTSKWTDGIFGTIEDIETKEQKKCWINDGTYIPEYEWDSNKYNL